MDKIHREKNEKRESEIAVRELTEITLKIHLFEW